MAGSANCFACAAANRSIVSFYFLYIPWPGIFNGKQYSPKLEVEDSYSTQGQIANSHRLLKPAVENRGHPFHIQS